MAPSNNEVAPWDTRPSQPHAIPAKAMAIFGTSADSSATGRKQIPRPSQTPDIAPWDTRPTGMHEDNIAPWERDPQAQISAPRSTNQSYFPETIGRYDGPAASRRPDTARTNTSDSPDFEADVRRPSIASATTVSSTGSKSSAANANGRFHKSLKGFFGEDPLRFPKRIDSESA